MAAKQRHKQGHTRGTRSTAHRRFETKQNKALLSQLPGNFLNKKDFEAMLDRSSSRKRITHKQVSRQTHKKGRTRRARTTSHTHYETKQNKTLLSQLPGNLLNKNDFEVMLGQSFTKSNQIKNIKDLSSNLQNIFRLNQEKSEYNCKYYTESTYNRMTDKIKDNIHLSILTFNIRSLNRNGDQLNIFLDQLTEKYDYICLTEIWLSNLEFLSNIFKGYKCKFVPPKSSKCGGVALFYRQDYKVEILPDLKINSVDNDNIDVDELWLSTETANGLKCTIGIVYRHPKSSLTKFNDRLYNVLEKINSDKSTEMCFIAGDFNANLLKLDSHNPTEKFLNNFTSNNFLPYIQLPTRITHKTSTLIDNIFVLQKKPKKIQNFTSGSFYSDISDHLPCFLLLEYPEKIPKQPRPKIRVYNEASQQKFIADLQQIDWAPIYKDENPDTAFNFFLNLYKQTFDKNFPLQTLSRSKSKQNPWMTKELNKMRKIRDKNKLKVSKGLIDEKEYKQHRNKTRQMMRQAQEKYYKELFDEKQNGMKQMWKHLGTLLNPRRSKGPQMIKRLFCNNTNVSENLAISETLNSHFCSVGKKLASKLPKSKKNFTEFLKSPVPNSIFFDKIDPKQVLGIINELRGHTSPGLDEITNKALKISADIYHQSIISEGYISRFS